MPDILSQDEIDQLLSAISSGEEASRPLPQNKVKIYDLKQPELVLGAKAKELLAISAVFCEGVQTSLASELGVHCLVHALSADTMRFEDFGRSTATLSPRARIDWNEACAHPIVMQLDPVPAEAILERLTGGIDIARGAEINATERVYTAFEKRILQRAFQNFARCLQSEFQQSKPEASFVIEGVALAAPHAMVTDEDELAVVITAEMKIGSLEGMLTVALPRKFIRFLWPLVELTNQRVERPIKMKSAPVILETSVERITYGKLKTLKPGSQLSLRPGSERKTFGVA